MASRLPTPGSDEGNWGDILNDYLRQAHTETGQIKAGAITAVQLNPGAITTTAVAHGSITEAKLSQDVKDKLNALDSVTDGREVELRTNTTHLQWRYKGGAEGDWTNLVGLSEITGPQGATGEKGEKGEQGDPATNLVTSVAGKQGVVTLDKTDVGLDNVPNTDFTPDVTANTAARHTHTNKATLDATDATFTTVKDTKLSSIATGATQNATDASLRDRATHTGTQDIATVAGLQGALDGKANDADVVKLAGNQTIAGVKTFSSALITQSGTSIGGVLHVTGTGFPNGVISAPVGSKYIDTVATSGAIEWVKASGAGNTGWVVNFGDTGWRNIGYINGILEPIKIRRIGNNVSFSQIGDGLTINATVSLARLTMPSGFRSSHRQQTLLLSTPGVSYGNILVKSTEPDLILTTTTSSQDYIAISSATFLTSDVWPSTLPGTPA